MMEIIMTALRFLSQSVSGLAVAFLAACASHHIAPTVQEQPLPPVSGEAAFSHPNMRPAQSADQALQTYGVYESVLAAAKNGDDIQPAQFLAQQGQSAMGESVRNEWLKNLAKRGQTAQFQQQYAQLDPAGRSQETRCYANLLGMENDSKFINELVEETGKLPAGCNSLLQARASQLNPSRAWRRVRGLISAGQTTDAANLAAALGSPLDSPTGFGAQENSLRDVIGTNAQKSPDTAAARLQQLSGSLNSEQSGFAWGVLGLVHAKNLNMGGALSYYRNADRNQLNSEQFEWFARAALRQQNWTELANIIQTMPPKLQNDPTWQYWLARALAAQGKRSEAQALYQKAAASGRNFYAVLATEELGGRVNAQNNAPAAQDTNIAQLGKDGAIQRALHLFHTSQQSGNWKMRRQAQNEWKYATRGMNEGTLLTAAQLASNHQFYEMSIHSADKTDKLLNYNLRYPTPFRELVTQYGNENGVDPAWVYGLIRQESRFVMGAQSSVGAQGLMQVMPATASMIARKIGMDNSELYTMNGNIRMGTWYMADARNSLGNSDVLATAGYNAGPGRARKWQGASMEGAIYAETIPFNETRDYVKKVLTNSVYYASILGEPKTSLKQRLGMIPAR